MEQNNLSYFRNALECRLRELLSEKDEFMRKLSLPLNEQGPIDEVELATSHHQLELMHLFQHRTNRIIKEIRSAIDRIETGEFGICCQCSDPIGPGRLRVQPTTVLCLACKQELELNGKTRRAA